MALRWRAPSAVAAVLLAAACAAPGATTAGGGAATGAGGGGGTSVASTGTNDGGGPAAVVPFAEFLAGISSATYQQYAAEPGAKVQDSAAFDQMRTYLLERYQEAHVTRSFADTDGGVFDCIARAGATEAGEAAATSGASDSSGTSDSSGASATAGTCPAGSFPTRRVTLSDLVRYPSLQQFFSKGPDGTGGIPLPRSTGS